MMKILSFTLLFGITLHLGFAQAVKSIERCKAELATKLPDTTRVVTMVILSNEYGWSNTDSAQYYAHKALSLAKRIHFLQGESLALAISSSNARIIGNAPKALAINLRANKIAEEHGYLVPLAWCKINFGVIYSDLEDYPKALSYYQEARKLALQTHDEIQATFQLINIGANFRKSNQLDSALFYLELSQREIKRLNMSGRANIMALRNLGQVHAALNHPALAISFLNQSLQVGMAQKDHLNISYAKSEIANLFYQSRQLDSCILYAKAAIDEARLINWKKGILNPSAQLSSAYQAKKDFKRAFEYQSILFGVKDALFGAQNIQALQSMIAQEKERQSVIADQKIAYQNQLNQYALLGGLVLLLLVAFFLYRNSQQERKAKILLSEKNKVIEQSLSTLQSTQAQLIQSEKLASLGELAAGIAHEIQNPLNFVNNFSELSVELAEELKAEIQKPDLDKNLIEELATDLAANQEKINHHGQRASSIVKGMLEHSRTSAGVKEPADLNALADEYLRLAYHGLRAKNNSFNAAMETHFDPDLPLVPVIPKDMGRVLLNLINNAFYAVNEKAKLGIEGYEPMVTVTTKRLENAIEIKIKDNGNGIPEAILEKIFQPFFTTKPTGQGTGLGLSLAYDIVTKGHGGTLEVESKNGAGTEFVIHLPC